MKILLSAYACEPNKGSEPAIGWNWALELANSGHEVWVLTRGNNKNNIETAMSNLTKSVSLKYVYHDLPACIRSFKKLPFFIYWYYFLWQWSALSTARRLHQTVGFDAVQHITFGSIRQPSFMGFLGIPFTFGPVAGGEKAPLPLWGGYPFKGKVLDTIRNCINALVPFDPLMRMTFEQATHIVGTSEQTISYVPSAYRHKCITHLAIGADEHGELFGKQDKPKHFKILFSGRLLYWKGIHLAIRAFAQFHREYPDSSLTIIGSGPEEHWLKKLAASLGIQQAIEWIPWMDRSNMMQAYGTHHVFLFPSLHDSGGMVVLEALSSGLPVICLKLGGPGHIVDATCGYAINVPGWDESEVIAQLTQKLVTLASSEATWQELSCGALARVANISWKKQVAKLYEKIEQGSPV